MYRAGGVVLHRNDETAIIFDMLEPVIAVVATVVLVFVANIVTISGSTAT